MLLNVFGIWQDDRYSKYVGETAIVPMTYGRHVPIISDKVNSDLMPTLSL